MTINEPTSEFGAPAAAGAAKIRLRLYVAGMTPSSIRATANLRTVLDSMGQAAANLVVETVDVAANPLIALKDRIIVTPTLARCDGSDAAPMVGDLGDAALVRAFIEAALRTLAAP